MRFQQAVSFKNMATGCINLFLWRKTYFSLPFGHQSNVHCDMIDQCVVLNYLGCHHVTADPLMRSSLACWQPNARAFTLTKDLTQSPYRYHLKPG